MNQHKNVSSFDSLRALWKSHADAYLVYKPDFITRKDIFYLTGFPGSTAVFLHTGKHRYLIVDSRYHETAHFHAKKGVTIIPMRYAQSYPDALLPLLKKEGVKRLALEDYTSIAFHEELKRTTKGIVLVSVKDLTMQVRMRKNKVELTYLREAQRITDRIHEHVIASLRPGKDTEYEIAHRIRDTAKSMGADDVSFDPIVAGGMHSARPHHVSGETVVPTRGPLLLDFGVSYKGYCSDFSRTLWVGSKPSQEFKDAYQVVFEAQEMGIHTSVFKGTVQASTIDAAARAIIDRSRFKGMFSHGLGHGVGLEIHEKPFLNASSKEILRGGEVITIEPGIYLPRKFGIRIEDMVIAGSGKIFSRFQRNLLVI